MLVDSEIGSRTTVKLYTRAEINGESSLRSRLDSPLHSALKEVLTVEKNLSRLNNSPRAQERTPM